MSYPNLLACSWVPPPAHRFHLSSFVPVATPGSAPLFYDLPRFSFSLFSQFFVANLPALQFFGCSFSPPPPRSLFVLPFYVVLSVISVFFTSLPQFLPVRVPHFLTPIVSPGFFFFFFPCFFLPFCVFPPWSPNCSSIPLFCVFFFFHFLSPLPFFSPATFGSPPSKYLLAPGCPVLVTWSPGLDAPFFSVSSFPFCSRLFLRIPQRKHAPTVVTPNQFVKFFFLE